MTQQRSWIASDLQAPSVQVCRLFWGRLQPRPWLLPCPGLFSSFLLRFNIRMKIRIGFRGKMLSEFFLFFNIISPTAMHTPLYFCPASHHRCTIFYCVCTHPPSSLQHGKVQRASDGPCTISARELWLVNLLVFWRYGKQEGSRCMIWWWLTDLSLPCPRGRNIGSSFTYL